MKICIFGAGAIGGYLAVRLANAGQDVSVVARGPHLKAMKEKGLRLLIDGQEEVAHVTATDNPPISARRITSSSRSRRIRCRPSPPRSPPSSGPTPASSPA
jgi:2-polyprenyl-6-methoxyphenol hydroxylase-like FAD-dependent oxidoreductase